MSEEPVRRRMVERESENGADSGLRGTPNQGLARRRESDSLVSILNEAAPAAQQAESPARQLRELRAELSRLRLEMAEREESVAAREAALNQLAGNFRVKFQTLQLRLQNAEAKLASRETELKEKAGVIEAAASREKAIGKLVVRLSAECEKLTAQLHQKSLIIARLEEKIRHPIGGSKLWKKVLRLLQQEPL
ncbi:MAG TPA: hypothetical protein VFU31_00860 [Candidatus Binatia bacterium]|nr:hypothetical protein [Candidatus Binatia bacterium]